MHFKNIDFLMKMSYYFYMIQIRKSWYELLKNEFEKPYFKNLQAFLDEQYAHCTVYPSQDKIFNALNHVPFDNVKVVIIGQDPYHEPGQAMGISFSVPEGVEIPPSLVNIFKEIHEDLGVECLKSGDLTRWANQGVLLLNTVLTVRRGQAGSHANKGWEILTGEIIKMLGAREKPIVFLLWGSYAQSFAPFIHSQHLVLKAPHPSPLSAYRGFFGCKHFSKCNEFLIEHGQDPINWQ